MGRIFRSDYPSFVSVDDEAVAAMRLATVVDLRRGAESARECPDWAARDVAYRRWPLTAGREDSWHARYVSYLTRRPETVVGAVREVMCPSAHPVLFHCAAGKDRTGVVAALLLSVLGVPDDDIVEDYMLSAASVGPVTARLLGLEARSARRRGGAEAWLLRRAGRGAREHHRRSGCSSQYVRSTARVVHRRRNPVGRSRGLPARSGDHRRQPASGPDDRRPGNGGTGGGSGGDPRGGEVPPAPKPAAAPLAPLTETLACTLSSLDKLLRPDALATCLAELGG